MNSTAENGSEISKLAHQPANIIGGRRVQNSGNHNHRHENLQDALREVLDSGLLAKMDRAYPTESVKRTHEKIQPATQPPFVNRGTSGGAQRFIPRKQNN
ncbi:hypothetical protein L5515_009515 [Caenorhabditis briggsae]|uniref:Uncharacterized protein n=1 Tax=Caenorhabditis briggsae TaxID=6238 RepID=A0AAE9JMC5_CAEBR|nr:hypothetical protein L5515_009515 [Caenorhabditis briggsae]